MTIWDAVRRFSGIGKRGTSPRPLHPTRSRRRDLVGSLRGRDLRVEQFEDRVLLSISPTSLNTLETYLSSSVLSAIQQATDLDACDQATLAATREWVVGLTGSALSNPRDFAASLGADYLGPTGIIDNTSVWEFSANTDLQTIVNALNAAGSVQFAYPLVQHEYVALFTPNDPIFVDQWHLLNTGQSNGTAGIDANVTPAWDYVTGAGIVIGVIDSGVEVTHPDLAANMRLDLSHDWADGDDDPTPPAGTPWENYAHGTSVAGVLGAVGNNGAGVSGTAPGVSIAGMRIEFGNNFTDTMTAELFSHKNNEIDIYNNSWGPTGALIAEGPLTMAALENAAKNGRDGLGNIFVFSAGNSRDVGANVNFKPLASSRYAVAVAAMNHNGTFSDYSTPGAALFVAAPSSDGGSLSIDDECGIYTTDRMGAEGYNTVLGNSDDDPLNDLNYTSTFGGTSSAAPLVSGIIALILEANPGLTYRDVQHILANTAVKNDPTSMGWATNGAGFHVSHDYGFGAVDAEAAVQAAASWVNVGQEVSDSSNLVTVGDSIPDNSTTGLTSTITMEGTVDTIEWVEVIFDASHASPGDLEIILISPSGTESRLAEVNTNPWYYYDSAGYSHWKFSTPRCWGESALGEWTLKVRDGSGGVTGTWNSWQLKVYGQHLGGDNPNQPTQTVYGPELVAVLPNEGDQIRDGNSLRIAPRELTFRFNEGQQINADTVNAIQIVRSGGDDVIGNANDVVIEYGWIGIGDLPNEVVVRFAEALPDDLYQITILGAGPAPLTNIQGAKFHGGENQSLKFDLDLGAQITAVVPQPTYRDASGNLQQSRNTIEVYFNDDELLESSAENVSFYRLARTAETATPADDNAVHPTSVAYDRVKNKAVLTFAQDLAEYGAGAFSLRIGNEYRTISTSSTAVELIADSFVDAYDTAGVIGSLGGVGVAESLIISSIIEPKPYELEWPGSLDEIGHRELPSAAEIEAHYGAGYYAADSQYGVATFYYNFKVNLGGSFKNIITEVQKQRAREIFEIYSYYLGVQFIEDTTGAQGFTVATGDMRVLDPYVETGPGGVIGLAGGGVAIMDGAETLLWGDSEYGGNWFRTAMHEIGHLLGLGHTYDLPAYTVMGSGEQPEFEDLGSIYYLGSSEALLPGQHDIVHGLHIYRPDSVDVDLYEVTLDAPGVFSAEITAERREDSSQLDSLVTIYNANHELIARNDDYYSEDSYVELELQPGKYYIAVSSTGNDQFDPMVPDSGIGGTSQGEYDLRLTFLPKTLHDGTGGVEHLVDTTGTRFDGNADGVPGGVYDFWFDVQSLPNTLFVDKIASAGGNGSLAHPYQNIDDALAVAQPNQIVRIVGNRDRTFVSQKTYAVGVAPFGVATGDFDRDGKMDIVTTNQTGNNVSIRFGYGDGTYRPEQPVYAVGKSPMGVVVGDLNGDGALDIVVADSEDAKVSILYNNGNGTFATQVTRFAGSGSTAVDLADVNGDAVLDIVVANKNADNVSVLLSGPDGTYADQVLYVVGEAPRALAMADVNNDLAIDILVANGDVSNPAGGGVSVLLNNGDGTFGAAAPLNINLSGDTVPTSVAVADFDGDGNRDLVASVIVTGAPAVGRVAVLSGNGDGTFDSPLLFAVGNGPGDVAVADVDRDGVLDIATSNQTDNSVSVLFGVLGGTFESAVTYSVGANPTSLVLADVDGDTRPDIVTANHGTSSSNNKTVSVLLGRRDKAYEIGKDLLTNELSDGWRMEIPMGVTVMIDAGAVFKLREANIDVGSSSQGIDRSEGSLQVLGTPERSVVFSSYHDKSIGEDHAAFDLKPFGGDWGGLVFRNDLDYDAQNDPGSTRRVLETEGIFLNYVNHAELRYGGGQVTVNGDRDVYNPVHMVEARPTVTQNTILYSADAAMSADPNSFADSKYEGEDYTTEYERIGPDIHGNIVLENTTNGLFVRIDNESGQPIQELEIAARWNDTDIVHVIAENLFLNSTPGGPAVAAGVEGLIGRTDARLKIDPGIFVKVTHARVEVEVGAELIAEGLPGYPIIFTSLFDDRYGAGGTYDTTGNGSAVTATPGDWGGLYFSPGSHGSIDESLISYAGGVTRIEGRYATFNPIEIHQADVRLANSTVQYGDTSLADSSDERNGRGAIVPAAVYIVGSQPILVNNVIRDNNGPAISADANSMTGEFKPDSGRSSNFLSDFEGYPDNYGPLVRLNRLHNNTMDGMVVRGAVLTTESVWDDSDITHILLDEIVVPNFHTYGGLRLQSGLSESLVVKLQGANAGITALGTTQEITDRIGGTLQIIGTPGFPVVLTSLADDSVGAGVDPWGQSQRDADNVDSSPVPGSWKGITLQRYVNDRNVELITEAEGAAGSTADLNGQPIKAQIIGELAPNELAGDDNLRLGFDIRGFIRDDNPADADVYGFSARAGTEVWIDIDRTTLGLDSIVELIDANGAVLARSDDSYLEQIDAADPFGIARALSRDTFDVNDTYGTNVHDAGMRLVLPGNGGELRTYYVRVRSVNGASSGAYDLEIRIRELQEISGSTIRNASIRYAVNGITMVGLPTNSTILGEAAEVEATRNYYDQVELDGSDNDFWIEAIPGGVTDQQRTNIYFVGDTGIGVGAPQVSYFQPMNQFSIRLNPGVTTTNQVIAAINAYRYNNVQIFSASLDDTEVDYDPNGVNQGGGTINETGWIGVTGNGVNDILDGAEPIGNLLQSDLASILVGGYITDAWDVDWYSFGVDLEQVQGDGAIQWPTVFDVDYADGMGRPELTVYVYDSDRKLVYSNSGANVDDDLASATGTGVDDVSRGSAGTNDPYIGPVRMVGGELSPAAGDEITYYVAIVAAGHSARALRQDVARAEPANSIVRVAEDHLNMSNMSGVSTQTSILWDTAGGELNVHVDDYHFNDVNLFVTSGADLYTIDPLTGVVETDVTGPGVRLADVEARGATYGDLAMRNDGRLMSVVETIRTGGDQNPYNGRYRELSTGDGSVVFDNDDGVKALFIDGDSVKTYEPGLRYTAIVPVPNDTQRRFWAIASSNAGVSGATWTGSNLVYLMDAQGNVIKPPGTEGKDLVPSRVLPYFWLDTKSESGVGENDPAPIITGLAYVDGALIAVDDSGRVYKVDGLDTGVSKDVVFQEPEDGKAATYAGTASLSLLTVVIDDSVTPPTTGNINQLKGYDTIEFTGLSVGPQHVEGAAYASVAFATATVDSSPSRLFAFTISGTTIEMAPVFVDSQSDITLVNTAGQPVNLVTTGLAFSNIDYNLWHMTSNRADGGADDEIVPGVNEPGHGIEVAPDGSRPVPFYREGGSSSFWFGLEEDMPGTESDEYEYGDRANTGALSTYDIAGGAHGSLTTDLFSLKNYESADLPVIFFNYYLDTANDPSVSTNSLTDAIRVYISTDGANWDLLASNLRGDGVTLLQDSIAGDTPNPVPAYADADKADDPNVWRQAAIGLGSYAGLENLRLRFDFSTAASMNTGDYNHGQETFLRAVPAWGLYGGKSLDGEIVQVFDPLEADQTKQTKYFEFDMGYSLVAPNSAGQAIPDGESFSFDCTTAMTATAVTVTFEFDKDGVLNNPDAIALPISDADSASVVAELIANVVSNLFVDADGDPDTDLEKCDTVGVQSDSWVLFNAGVTNLVQTAAPGFANPVMVLGSEPGVATHPEDDEDVENFIVAIDPRMTAAEVAEQLALVMDRELAVKEQQDDGAWLSLDNPDVFNSVKLNEDFIQFVTVSDGNFIPQYRVIQAAGPLGYANALAGEGEAGVLGGAGTNFSWNLRGVDNRHEGFYLDDVTIGFAERGLMYTDMNPSRDMRPQDPGQAIKEGYYQMEIRTATDYSSGVYDTNDRHTEDITLVIPSAEQIIHRQTFTINDGVNTQTFQFLALGGNEFNPTFMNLEPDEGAIPIYYQHGETDATIGGKVLTAINNAAAITTTATRISTSNRIELTNAASVDGMASLIFATDGEDPIAIEVLDLNPPLDPDVIPINDIVTVNEFDASVTVYIDTLGSFSKYDVGTLPSDLVISDVDADGYLDLIVSNSGDDTVSILLGNANVRGTFESQLVFGVGHNPSGVAVFDMDADGNLDVVTSNKGDNTVSILYGNGDGTFGLAEAITVGLEPMDVAAGDIDNNGMGDIVTANSGDNSVTVLREVGGGVFAATTYSVGRLPVAIALGDLNPDQPANPDDPPPPRWLDIVTANRTDGTVSVLMNDGSGGYGESLPYDAGESPVSVRLLDENNDDRLDAIVANYSAGSASILHGRANPEMMFVAPATFSLGQYGPRAVTLGDADGDGTPDLVSANYINQSISILPGTGYSLLDLIVIGSGDSQLQQLQGDENRVRDQGQVIIAANEVLYSAEYGIKVAPGARDAWSHPGAAVPLREVNQQRLVPGVTIENNLVVASGLAGIYFGGDYQEGASVAAVPFGRIVNNTIYGGGTETVSDLDIELLDPFADAFGDFRSIGAFSTGNNDNFSVDATIGFNINFAGLSTNKVTVNVNGTVSFDSDLLAVNPAGFPNGVPVISPFWADVDARYQDPLNPALNNIIVSAGTSSRGNPVFQVDWYQVGYSNQHTDKRNWFTLYIEDDPNGDIVVFAYRDMEWTTGDQDGGVGGFGGTGAIIGMSSGNGVAYMEVGRPKTQEDLDVLTGKGMYIFRLDPATGLPPTTPNVGIEIGPNASPTLLNNIVSNLAVGIQASKLSTPVIGGTVYQGNAKNTVGTGLGEFSMVLGPNDPLFVDAEDGNFYLAAGSQAIDSSINSLPDRPSMIAVRAPLGISQSPIIAPDVDLYGQLRSDDPSIQPPSGLGSNVFKDRGAVDRVDFYVPMATLLYPSDNDLAGVDRNPDPNDVFIDGERIEKFTIQLADTGGTGIDDRSVSSAAVKLYMDNRPVPMTEGVDYFFRYDAGTDLITLVPAAGLWEKATTYTIVLDNSPEGIRDVAGNLIRPNRLDGTTKFVIAHSEFDYGDVTKDGYPTTLAQDGARHLLIGDWYLGEGVTGETDAVLARDENGAVLVNNATGDSKDDGVVFDSWLLAGQEIGVTVTASRGDGLLDAWIDFDGDGDWEPEERIFDHLYLSAGQQWVGFQVPEGTTTKTTFARFRYSRDGVDLPTGEAITGEAEDYLVKIVEKLQDFGDAPAPYPTLEEDGGAYHAIDMSVGLWMGQLVDQEFDGQPHLAALGDDAVGVIDGEQVLDDEDGVTFLDWLVPGKYFSIMVNASRADGFLNAWIDFNGDFVWSEDEQIVSARPLTQGENEIAIANPVPTEAGKVALGATFARFRVSMVADLDPTGGALDGEVEDYRVLITNTPRDFGDAPRSFSTKRDPEPATALLHLAGENNDLFLTANDNDESFGEDFNDIKVFVVNTGGVEGNLAIVKYNPAVKTFIIDVDPTATRANTVRAAINAEGTFVADLDTSLDVNNDGTGLVAQLGKLATTANGFDGSGDDAASHLQDGNGLWLGSTVDVEVDGQPSDDSLGDDLGGVDDEDGVTLPERFIAGQEGTIYVNVHKGAVTNSVYLNAWIDLNLDGTWTDDEHLIQGVEVQDGQNTLPLAIPITALAGNPHARFRLSTNPDLDFHGADPNGGEVEDYQIEIGKGDAVITGWVFEDRDKDGHWDTLEKGIPGATVYIDLNNNNVLDSGDPVVQTMYDDLATVGVNETGLYRFDGLLGRTDKYIVRHVVPNDYVLTYPDHTVQLPDGSHSILGGAYEVFLEESETVENVTFGDYRRAHVTVTDVAVAEGNAGYKEVQVTLSLSGSFGTPVTVKYDTNADDAQGTATVADADYVDSTGLFTFGAQNTPPPSWTKTVLTDNATNDYDYAVSGDYVVWEGFDGNDWEIYLYRKGVLTQDGDPEIVQLTNNDTDDTFASVYDTGNGANVVWVGKDEVGQSGDDEIFFRYQTPGDGEGSFTKQLGNNTYEDKDPQVSGTKVVWWAHDWSDTEIFMVDLAGIENTDVNAIAPLNVSDNYEPDSKPHLSGENVVWTGVRNNTTEIFVYAGELDDFGNPLARRVTTNSREDDNPDIDGNLVVWESYVGTAYEVFVYDISTSETTQITTNSRDDRYPRVSGTDVVWQGHDGSDWEVYHYNAEAKTPPVNITNNTLSEEQPAVADGRVVWRVFTGANWEVYSHELRGDGTIQNLSNSTAYEYQPKLSGSLVIWRSYEGGDYEIVVAEAQAPVVTQTVTVRVIGDTKAEDDQYFFLKLTPQDGTTVIDDPDVEPSGVDIPAATIWILNDDGNRDFGDAPAPYPTYLVDNGARHRLVSTLKLGSLVDFDSDGKPGELANGDDVAYSDDEDGIVFATSLGQGALNATIVVTASGVDTLGNDDKAYLNAWIDFNADGDWDDEREHVFIGTQLIAGANTLAFEVPGEAVAGFTYARFRLSTVANLAYTGQAPDGEVEDYRVEIKAKPAVVGGLVALTGTSGSDVLEVTATAEKLYVMLNGASYSYPVVTKVGATEPTLERLTFDGGAGSDKIIVHGSDGDESVELWSNRGVWLGPGDGDSVYRVETTSVETAEIDGGLGNDSALLHDTAQKDALVGGPITTTLSGLGYSLSVDNFETVDARSTLGGEDTADLYDSTGNDIFLASPTSGEIGQYVGDEGATPTIDAGSPYHVIASGFRYLRAHATRATKDAGGIDYRGYDRVQFTDSTGVDTFTASPTVASLVGEGFHLEANLFERVKAAGTAANADTANLYDSAGDETFTSQPAGPGSKSFADLSSKTLETFDFGGAEPVAKPIFRLVAESFRYATGSAANGGNDTAMMYASAGEDTLEAGPTYARLYGANFFNRVEHFPEVFVYGNTGESDANGGNVAKFYDSAGDDTMTAGGNNATLTGPGFTVTANFFSSVTAYSTQGGKDTATLTGATGVFDTFVGTTTSGKLFHKATPTQAGYSYEAYGFDTVTANADKDDQDIAQLYDSLDFIDILEAEKRNDTSWARLSNSFVKYEHILTGFKTVTANATTSGDIKQVSPDAIDFLLATGTWQDL